MFKSIKLAWYAVLGAYRVKVRPRAQRIASWIIEAAFVILITLSIFGVVATSIAIWIDASVELKDPQGEIVSLPRATAIFFSTAWQFILSPKSIGAFEHEVIKTYANVWVFILSLFSIVVSSLYIFKEKRVLHSTLPYREHAISSTEKLLNEQATPIMRRYYSSADKVLVLSGDYDWLFSADGTRIADRLQELAGKGSAILLSYKDPGAVLAAWKRPENDKTALKYKALFERITFMCPVQFKASLITKRSGANSFIFLSDMDDLSGGSAAQELRQYKIFEYHSGGNARPLMNMIDELCSLAHHSAEAKKQNADAARTVALNDVWWSGTPTSAVL